MPAEDTSYSAQWRINQYTATFDANGGTGGCTKTQDYGTELDAPAVGRTGYFFTGWLPDVPDTMPAQNQTYVAQWELSAMVVALEKEGGTGGTDQIFVQYGDSMPLIQLPTRTGCTFGGYYTERNGSGTQYYTATGTSARTWDKDTTDATTLYAQWRSDLGEFSEALDTNTLRFYCDDGGWVVTNDSSAVGGTCVATTSAVAVVELKVEANSVGTLTFNWKLLRPENDDDINEGYFARLIPENLAADIPWSVSTMPYKADWTAGNANLTNGVYKFTFDPGANSGVHPFNLLLDKISWTPEE
jgi:hypothetical protein